MPRIGARLDHISQEDVDREGRGWIALEPGEYTFQVTETEFKEAKSGKGMVLTLSLECLDEGFSAKWKEFLTIEHENSQTAEIACRRLKQYAQAVNLANPDAVEDSEELEGVPFLAVVGVREEPNAQYADVNGQRNYIKRVQSLTATPAPRVNTREAKNGDAKKTTASAKKAAPKAQGGPADKGAKTADEIPF